VLKVNLLSSSPSRRSQSPEGEESKTKRNLQFDLDAAAEYDPRAVKKHKERIAQCRQTPSDARLVAMAGMLQYDLSPNMKTSRRAASRGVFVICWFFLRNVRLSILRNVRVRILRNIRLSFLWPIKLRLPTPKIGRECKSTTPTPRSMPTSASVPSHSCIVEVYACANTVVASNVARIVPLLSLTIAAEKILDTCVASTEYKRAQIVLWQARQIGGWSVGTAEIPIIKASLVFSIESNVEGNNRKHSGRGTAGNTLQSAIVAKNLSKSVVVNDHTVSEVEGLGRHFGGLRDLDGRL
jgi:hypothetical protein